jgi:hypothetical protein
MQKVPYSELAKLWTSESSSTIPAPPARIPVFTNPGIIEFYSTAIENKPYFANKQLDVILELLELLDRDGNCSSVVNKHNQEAEKPLPADTYKMLGAVPLCQHSINVARHIMQSAQNSPLTPKMVICALAHDIGKIPHYYNPMCTSAVHGFISAQTLESLGSIKLLNYSAEVLEAIRLHHTPPDGNYLAKALREADFAARREEVTIMSSMSDTARSSTTPPPGLSTLAAVTEQLCQAQAINEPDAEPATPKPATPEPVTPKTAPRTVKTTNSIQDKDVLGMPLHAPNPKTAVDVLGMPLRAPDDPLGHPTDKARAQAVPIPWFEPQPLKTAMASLVNKPIPGERYWGAISMPDGFCYFKLKTLWFCIKKAFPNVPDIKVADTVTQNDFLLSIAQALVLTKDVPSTVRKNQLGVMYIINPDSEKPYDLYLLPIQTTSLGLDVQNSELTKPDQYKTVKQMKPKYMKITRPAL